MSATPSATNTTTEPAVRYIASSVEHTLIIDHPECEEQVNFCLDHFGSHHTLTIAIFDMLDSEQPELREQIIFNYADARLLKSLLCRPEVSTLLDAE